MPSSARDGLIGALVLSVAAGGVAHAQWARTEGGVVLAQLTPEEKKRKEEERRKAPPPRPTPSGPPPSPDKRGAPGGPPPPPKAMVPPDKGPPPFERKVPTVRPMPSGPPPPGSPPPVGKTYEPPTRKATEEPFIKKGPSPDWKSEKELPKRAIPGTPPPPVGGAAPTGPKTYSPPGVMTPPKATGPIGPPPGVPDRKGPAFGGASPRFDEVQKGRKERVEAGRRVIEEPGGRTIVKHGDRTVIRSNDAERFRGGGRDVKSVRRPDGHTETFYVRPDGTRVVSVVDGNGRLVRRYRRGHDGREHNIIDNRRFLRNVAIGVGVGAVGLAILSLAPPRISIPREKYIVDYERASEDDIYEAFDAPPVERLERAYSLEEIRDNVELRQRMRYVELNNLHFESGAWEITPDQYFKLERLARAIHRVLRRNPDEVFFVEGHTDAVGSDVDNLSLSDRRASAVAMVLTESFGVPPENLVTQGYGEQFQKIPTPGPEPLNRRVEVRRVGPLMAER
jgi:outer membrane protein OmpA-like peptidoglycan-associated protein